MSDTTTTLNPGVGGDVMDEELITQPTDGVTVAKRPRVVIAGKTGASIVNPVSADPGASPYAVPTLIVTIVKDAPEGGYVSDELRALTMTTDGRLRVSSVNASTYMDMFGDTSPISTDSPCLLTSPPNPWK